MSAEGYQYQFIDAFCKKLQMNDKKDTATIDDYINFTIKIFNKVLDNYIINDKNHIYPLSRFNQYMQYIVQATTDTITINKLKMVKLLYEIYDIFAKRIIEERRLIDEDVHKIIDKDIIKFNILDPMHIKEFFKILSSVDIIKLNNENINISKFIVNINIVNMNMFLDHKDEKLYYYMPDSTSAYIMRYICNYINNQLYHGINNYIHIKEFIKRCLITDNINDIDIKNKELKETFYSSINLYNTLFICGLLSKGLLDFIEEIFYINSEEKCKDKNEILFIMAPLYLAFYLSQYKKTKDSLIEFINKYLPSYKQKAINDKEIGKFINNCTQNNEMFNILKSFYSGTDSIYEIKDFIKWFNDENILG